MDNEIDLTGIFDDDLLTTDEMIAFGSGGEVSKKEKVCRYAQKGQVRLSWYPSF